MAKWLITREITKAEGNQTFRVEAETSGEALEKYLDEGGEFVSEEIDVQDLGSLYIEAEE